MDIADTELIADFRVESQEGLANIEQQMLAIETAGADIDVDLVNAVFRTMHSIKGASGFLGLDSIGTLAHSLEEVLNRMRNREIVPSSELVTTVLHAADSMKGLIDAVETSNEADVSNHVAALAHYLGASAAHSAPAAPQAETRPEQEKPSPIADVSAEAANEAVREFLIECYENLDQMDQDLLALEQEPNSPHLVRSIFRTMHTIKGGAGFLGLRSLEKLAHAAESLLGRLREGSLQLTSDGVTALLASMAACREGLRLLESQQSDSGFDPSPTIAQLFAAAGQEAPAPALNVAQAPPIEPQAISEVLPRAKEPTVDQEAKSISASTESISERHSNTAGDSTIRVDVALLDKLMTRVGELVLARNQILQRTSGLEDSEFISTAQRLNLITTELQEGVMKTRMQPIGNVWAKFPRVVRDLAAQLGKQVRIEMEGKETELDKTIVEAIKDPLTHLVRNSVDHGIESPAARRAAGKPEEGCLLLRAYHEGGQVNIEITDDGAGIHLERIRKKAVEKGLISAEQAAKISDREATQLILLPGFSTAEQVTSVSGRGVGMDVVKTNIEKIGGTLDLQSQLGQGTTIKIKIPLTLAIIPALIVTSGGDRYAIPQVSLLELVRLEGDQVKRSIEFVHGAPVYRLRGKLLPLVDLSERLGLTSADGNSARFSDRIVNIVVLRANDHQYGLVVDKVNDSEEIVVKPLSRQLKGLGEYAGTTIMGDGTVALILDVLGLAVASGLRSEVREASHSKTSKDDSQTTQQAQSLLVVDLGDSRRFALPTSMVARLEKVPGSAIEDANGRQVIQYRGAILPLVRLSRVFGAVERDVDRSQDLQIIVYSEGNLNCGFVVNRIVDIVETELRLQTKRPADDNLLGTTVIQQRVTDVLNLRNLARHEAHSDAGNLLAAYGDQ